MKKSFLLTIIMISFSHSVLAMEALSITMEHLADMVQLVCAINNHDSQAYEKYPRKENLPYDVLQPLSDYNLETLISLEKEQQNQSIAALLIFSLDNKIAAHRQIGCSLCALMQTQMPIRAEAAKKRSQEISHLAEYKCNKEFEETYKMKKQERLALKTRELLASVQNTDNEQENVLASN